MAKLRKPFGRQIAKVKAQAAEALGGSKDKEALASKANELARKEGYAYEFTADSFTSKRGRKKKRAGRVTTNGAPRTAAPAQNGSFTVSDIQEAKKLLDSLGKEKARELINLLA